MKSDKPHPKTQGSANSFTECDRRDFLRIAGLSAAGLLSANFRTMAGPFELADFDQLVPADKQLSPQWIRSLYERGALTEYRGKDLRNIGMPVGGLCAGQLYLGGDGKLWHWDIFNLAQDADFGHFAGPHYAKPAKATSPIEQGFAIKISTQEKTQVRALDQAGFKNIAFRGQYPIGFVDYQDEDLPVKISLEAFSPFIPLNPDDSSLPATILEYTVVNTSREPVRVELAGWLENAVCLESGRPGRGQRRSRFSREKNLALIVHTAEAAPQIQKTAKRPDILFDNFEKETYEGWTASGTAFGEGPIEAAKMPAYQGAVEAEGKRLVNTHNARHGEDVYQADAHAGTLTSRSFVIERDFINFLIGGGAHKGKTCINLMIDGQPVCTATGANDNRLKPHSFDVRGLAGKTAQLQLVDKEKGGWGNIGLDDIVFSDTPKTAAVELTQEPDFGSLAIGIIGAGASVLAAVEFPAKLEPEAIFAKLSHRKDQASSQPFGQKFVGALSQAWRLKPGQKARVSFVIAWHFPTLRLAGLEHITDIRKLRRSYGKRFESAAAVARHIAKNYATLTRQTKQWHQTWLDSTLPWWFLDRTFLNISILATATCYHFDNGRFYGWEGTYCCAGTCSHVWQYAQAAGRLFPQLERSVREMVDYGLAFHPESGAIDYRAEAHRRVATDGQAGTILRAYREHQTAPDNTYLNRHWPRIKKSIEYLINEDGNDDGLLEGEQYNTLDASWYGQIAWLSSLYLAAVRAGEAMAGEMGDDAFARRCAAIAESGRRLLVEKLFNGQYFIHRPDPKRADTINTNDGCHIDQVYGQSWAFQVGLPRVIPENESRKALEALWRYNFAPDVGPYRENFKAIKGGRWYAMPGEGGLLMCTWPRGGAENAAGKGEPGFVAYFNECMTGFEYQAAAHMIWEGLVEQGLAVTRMIHDRYHASRRNPWNEIECSDHYARAMASYGVYLAACGFEYHGPQGYMAFDPRLVADNFKAAFTAAEGWGTFTQIRNARGQTNTLQVHWGRLRLKALKLALKKNAPLKQVKMRCGWRTIQGRFVFEGHRVTLMFDQGLLLTAGQELVIILK